MSRFLKTAIVLLAIAAMAAPAFAADNLTLGGQMRVRGWYVGDGTNDGVDSTSTWADQRLRIGGKFSVADGVSITFRTDVTESNWGSGNKYGSGRIGVQQWDRAHIDLDFGNVTLRAGQQFVWFLETGAFNTQSNGLVVKTKGPVAVTVFGFLQDDNGATTGGYAVDNDKFVGNTTIPNPNYGTIQYTAPSPNNADGFNYGVNVGFGADAFKANVLVAAQNKVLNSDEDVYLIGGEAIFNLDMVKITTELDFFTGDAAAAADAFGTQFYADAAFSASEAVTVGGQLFYALGDTTDTQYDFLGNDFGGYDPLDALGTGLDNEQIGTGRPFTFFGNNSGVIAGRVYALAKLSDALNVGASLAYLEPEEDANTTTDSALVVATGLKYAFLTNTSVGVQLQYVDKDDAALDAFFAGGVGLFVNF